MIHSHIAERPTERSVPQLEKVTVARKDFVKAILPASTAPSTADTTDPPSSSEIGSALKTLGRNIRSLRRRLGLSQERLAGTADLHRTYICDVERGSRNVTVNSLIKIAGGLRTSVAELARGVGPEQPQPAGIVSGSVPPQGK